jgi:hypothetical protein
MNDNSRVKMKEVLVEGCHCSKGQRPRCAAGRQRDQVGCLGWRSAGTSDAGWRIGSCADGDVPGKTLFALE